MRRPTATLKWGQLLHCKRCRRMRITAARDHERAGRSGRWRQRCDRYRLADGSYDTNVYIDRVVSRGGGRGVFCVSQSGAAEIASVDLADNGNNAVLIENCYNVAILDGTVDGGGWHECQGVAVRREYQLEHHW
ncbi:hypothetical protein KC345_g92 [Hortaea werneckii]|nr:hypothetical protein KC345_g92 [Hortaea werneckii]